MKNKMYYTNKDTPRILKHLRVGGAQTTRGVGKGGVRRDVPHEVPSPLIQVYRYTQRKSVTGNKRIEVHVTIVTIPFVPILLCTPAD